MTKLILIQTRPMMKMYLFLMLAPLTSGSLRRTYDPGFRKLLDEAFKEKRTE